MAVLDLFSDFRDGSRLLDLLEVMCSQRMVSVFLKSVHANIENICSNAGPAFPALRYDHVENSVVNRNKSRVFLSVVYLLLLMFASSCVS